MTENAKYAFLFNKHNEPRSCKYVITFTLGEKPTNIHTQWRSKSGQEWGRRGGLDALSTNVRLKVNKNTINIPSLFFIILTSNSLYYITTQ